MPGLVSSFDARHVVLVNFTDSNVLCIAILTLAFFAHGVGPLNPGDVISAGIDGVAEPQMHVGSRP